MSTAPCELVFAWRRGFFYGILIMDANSPLDHAYAHRRAGGHVTLVGAGPGDPELLTLKAVRAISEASVILVDDLVNEAVLTHASPRARIIHVGKRGGCKSTPQGFIEKMMMMAAKEGENVVRLKGGDPFIFGRGGEEVANLQAEGIAVNVVNGISAGLAASTSLGVPLTHRQHAHGVVFVTGHNKPDDPGTDWRALAGAAHQLRLTLVIYMGVACIQSIEAGLLAGLPPDTPVAIVQNASLPTQHAVLGQLASLAETVRTEGLGSPSVVIVGQVLSGLAQIQAMARESAHRVA